jgi:rSAM/selenodomain-associated transferase 2
MKISVIIPTLNEAANIGRLIRYLMQHSNPLLSEIIVSDGGSTDDTEGCARASGCIFTRAPKRGRAAQMNHAVRFAKGDVLYFIHADALPPESYLIDIQMAIESEQYLMGCYRFEFDSPKILLKINAFCTRFRALWCRGGDQTLFVTRSIFNALNGYREDFVIMEEYDFIQRAYHKNYSFKIIPKTVLISARKYETNSYWQVQWANFTVFNMYLRGAPQQRLADTYKQMLNYR